VLAELAKLVKVPNLHKILEKSASGMKWKMIEEVFERRKNDSRFFEKKGKIVALGIFGLVLFPNLTKIISLKATITFVVYKNTQINLTMMIVAKTILTLNHYIRVLKDQ
jgi:hypothetical protein